MSGLNPSDFLLHRLDFHFQVDVLFLRVRGRDQHVLRLCGRGGRKRGRALVRQMAQFVSFSASGVIGYSFFHFCEKKENLHVTLPSITNGMSIISTVQN